MISAACVAGSSHVAMAASAYGPPPPPADVGAPPPPAGVAPRPAPAGVAPPGGFSGIVTSQTITPAGGTIGPLTVDGACVILVIPPRAFPVSAQITITAPDLSAVGDAGLDGYKAVAGVGIQVQVNGLPYPGTFLKSLILTVCSSSITTSSVVVVWKRTAFVTETDATVRAGIAVVRFDTDPDFAILSPAEAPPTGPIPGATRPITGKPFLGEGILAGALLALGATGIVVGCRRRHERPRHRLSRRPLIEHHGWKK